MSSSVALEQQQVQIVLADSVNDLQPHKEEPITNSEQISSREETLLRVKTSNAPSNILETKNSIVTLQNNTIAVTTSDSGILQRRPSDPRLVNISPVSNTNPFVSPGYGFPLVTSTVSPVAVVRPIAGQSVVQLQQSNDSSGTPGKKKVGKVVTRRSGFLGQRRGAWKF